MGKTKSEEETSLKDILNVFIESYTERDKNIKFSGWLGDKLQQEMPGLSKEAGEKLAGEIIEAVTAYGKTLNELNMAVEAGQAKEEWLADRLAESYAGMYDVEAGEKLIRIEENIASSNQLLMQGISGGTTALAGNGSEQPVEWNKRSVKETAHGIGKQVAMMGMAVAANVVKERIQNEDTADIGNVIKKTLRDDLIKDPDEVKAVVAGAVKIAAEKGFGNIMPEDTTVDVIGNVAGAAVECAEALADMADGKTKVRIAVGRIGMAAVAAGGNVISEVVRGTLEQVPYVGGVLTDLAGGLVDHLRGPKFAKDVYDTIHNTVVATWEGIKESQIGRMFTKLKKKVYG